MKKQLLVLTTLLVLGGCSFSGNKTAKSSLSVSSSTSEVKHHSTGSDSSHTSYSNSTTSQRATTSSSSSVTNQATNVSRVTLMNQQLMRSLGQVPLPQTDGLENGSNRLNVYYQGDSNNFTINYSVGSRAKKFNDATLKQENPYAVYTKKTYESETTARQQIGYRSATEFKGLPTVDLGDELTGTIDAGAGQQYLSWYEGNWFLTVHATTVNQGDPQSLAKEVVSFLAKNSLPAPENYGRVSFQTAIVERQREQLIIWQKGNAVYQLQTHTPQTALKMAVSIK